MSYELIAILVGGLAMLLAQVANYLRTMQAHRETLENAKSISRTHAKLDELLSSTLPASGEAFKDLRA